MPPSSHVAPAFVGRRIWALSFDGNLCHNSSLGRWQAESHRHFLVPARQVEPDSGAMPKLDMACPEFLSKCPCGSNQLGSEQSRREPASAVAEARHRNEKVTEQATVKLDQRQHTNDVVARIASDQVIALVTENAFEHFSPLIRDDRTRRLRRVYKGVPIRAFLIRRCGTTITFRSRQGRFHPFDPIGRS